MALTGSGKDHVDLRRYMYTYMALTGSGKDHVYIWPSVGQVKTMYIYGPHWVR